MKHTINYFELPSSDHSAMKKFYGSLFGWGDFRDMPEMDYVTLTTGNTGCGLVAIDEQRKAGEVILYVDTDNIEATLEKISAHGGSTVIPRQEIPNNNGAFAYFKDPTGNTVAIYEWPQSDADMTPDFKGRPIVHAEIPADDRKALADFYHKVFGWGVSHMEEPVPYSGFSIEKDEKHGLAGGGFPDTGEMYKPGDVVVYIGSEDLAADKKAVESAGGKVLTDTIPVPGFGELFFWLDVSGNRLAFWRDTSGQQ